MKKWKKTHRQRKRSKKLYTINLKFNTIEEYGKINLYRISKSYSWGKLASIAIKNAIGIKSLDIDV